jgi:DMSO/TMAO reductase YedYZ molybdopterin-dependent catalytic subunit
VNRSSAAAGAVAAGVALGVSELLSGLYQGFPSLVLGIADVVVEETPGPLVRWSIETFGPIQKTLLVIGIVVVTLALGALLGLVARRRFWLGAAGFVGLAVAGGWAAATTSLTAPGWAWLSALVAATAGIAVLWLLLRPAPGGEPSTPIPQAQDRRRFLLTAGAAAAVAVAGGAVGRFLRQANNVEASRRQVAAVLGTEAEPVIPASVASFDRSVDGIAPLITPNDDFYRIDTAILSPQVDPGDWTLRVTGMVDNPLELTLDDLLAMDRIQEFVTLACVSNEVGGDLVGNARWSGVPLRDLLDRAGIHEDATQIVGRSVDGWTAGFPTEIALDGRPAMVAVAMNGEPLPIDHGFPARLVVPGLYGYVSATKWLAEIELTTWDGFDAYWVPRGWAKEGPIKTQSRIDVPRAGSSVTAGRAVVAGVAWAPTRSIELVEVRVDDEPWRPVRLSGSLSDNAWVQWVFDWDAAPGTHRLQVRATDGRGEVQTAETSPPAPSGATGYHTIDVSVSG